MAGQFSMELMLLRRGRDLRYTEVRPVLAIYNSTVAESECWVMTHTLLSARNRSAFDSTWLGHWYSGRKC